MRVKRALTRGAPLAKLFIYRLLLDCNHEITLVADAFSTQKTRALTVCDKCKSFMHVRDVSRADLRDVVSIQST